MSAVGPITGIVFGLLVTVMGIMITAVNWHGPVRPNWADWGYGFMVTVVGIAIIVDGLATVGH